VLVDSDVSRPAALSIVGCLESGLTGSGSGTVCSLLSTGLMLGHGWDLSAKSCSPPGHTASALLGWEETVS
jgi:hypothetical protein